MTDSAEEIAANVAKTVVLWKLSNWVLYAGMIGLTHRYHPMIALDQRFMLQSRLASNFPRVFSYGKQMYNKTVTRISQNSWYNSFCQKVGLNPDNTVRTIAEASVLFKSMLPVTFPITWYGAYYFVNTSSNGAPPKIES